MEQNYDELIQSFCAFTMNQNIDIAIQYLSRNNWDLHLAYNEYISQQIPEEEHKVEEIVPQADVDQAPAQNNWQFSIFNVPYMVFGAAKYILSPIGYIYRRVFQNTDHNNFQTYLQNINLNPSPRLIALNLHSSMQYANDRNKMLLLYIHDSENGDDYIRQTFDRQVVSIINDSFFLYGQFREEAAEIRHFFGDLSFAVISGEMLLGKIENKPNKAQLIEFLMQFLVNIRSREVSNIQDRFIREQQERELREAERIEIEKHELAKKKEREAIMAQKKIEEDKREKELEIERKARMIGEEPPVGQDVSLVVFRLPNGGKLERRFKKDSSIEIVKAFVGTKVNEGFELVSGYPSVVVNEGTLESQGMHPRALIHVRLVEGSN